LSLHRQPPTSTLFPYTTLFRSLMFRSTLSPTASRQSIIWPASRDLLTAPAIRCLRCFFWTLRCQELMASRSSNGSGSNLCCAGRSEEHTSELQSPCNLVCRLLL